MLHAHVCRVLPVLMAAVQNVSHPSRHDILARLTQGTAFTVACKSNGTNMLMSWIVDRSSLLEGEELVAWPQILPQRAVCLGMQQAAFIN